VAELVATATEGQDANLMAAAVLHDTVEDTATLPAELAAVFNADVASLVLEVTDTRASTRPHARSCKLNMPQLNPTGPNSSSSPIKHRI